MFVPQSVARYLRGIELRNIEKIGEHLIIGRVSDISKNMARRIRQRVDFAMVAFFGKTGCGQPF
jgi:hypothetical protein